MQRGFRGTKEHHWFLYLQSYQKWFLHASTPRDQAVAQRPAKPPERHVDDLLCNLKIDGRRICCHNRRGEANLGCEHSGNTRCFHFGLTLQYGPHAFEELWHAICHLAGERLLQLIRLLLEPPRVPRPFCLLRIRRGKPPNLSIHPQSAERRGTQNKAVSPAPGSPSIHFAETWQSAHLATELLATPSPVTYTTAGGIGSE